jgi:cullin 4
MYSFPPRKPTPSNNAVVDLTDSPPSKTDSSPRRPKAVSRDPHQGAKKILVKNFRTTPRIDPKVYVEGVLTQLDEALDGIFGNSEHVQRNGQTNGKIPHARELLYKGVENACKMKSAEELCSRLDRKAKESIMNRTVPVLLKTVNTGRNNVAILKDVLDAWSLWKQQMSTVQAIYMYMDRAYLLRQGLPSIQETGVSLFRGLVLEDSRLQEPIFAGACDLITAERIGQPADQTLCSEAVAMYHELGVYTHTFEPRLLAMSQTFIKEWSEEAARERPLSEYIVSSIDLMEKEMRRCEICSLDTSTRSSLLKLLEDHLILRQSARLVREPDVAELLSGNEVDILEKLYSLLQRLGVTSKLSLPFSHWIDATGTSIVFDEKDADNMVIHLLALKTQLDNIWHTSFHRDTDLGHILRESFEDFINKSRRTAATHGTDNSKPGEMIAKYVDMLLRGGSKAIPPALSHSKIGVTRPDDAEDDADEDVDEDKEVNIQLDQVLDLFRFLHGKAVFEAFYKKDLARRLLLNRSASADAERSMLTRLKNECGAQFTSNLEQMFKDIELGREEMQAYKSFISETDGDTGVDLSVNILSAAAWPSYPDIPVNIPPSVAKEISRFETFYRSKHSGRKLTWKHALAHCQLKASFPTGNKELVVSGFQAIVLLHFNNIATSEHISYETLKASTGLPDQDLQRTLQSLACAKLRPLTKHPKGRDVNPADTFTLDPTFKHPKYRVKINQVQLKETKEENKETHERVAADRNFETQAAIVRVMKAKKQIHHNNLIAEVIEVTKKRGVLSMADIKKNIDRYVLLLQG